MYDLLFCEYILHETEKTHDNYKFKLSLIDLFNNKN